MKIDYKKEYKDLYLPKQNPVLIDVPAMNFIMVNGKGSPQSAEYQAAIQTLYTLTFTIKMSKMSGQQPEDYFEYVVPPLEGLWWIEGGAFDMNEKSEWLWTSMIRQPEFVTPNVFEWAVSECKRKKTEVNVSSASFVTFTEGLSVQLMHIGPYSAEPESLAKIDDYIENNNLINDVGIVRKHHEIYLSDPRKVLPEKIKTVLRIPVSRK